MEKGKGKERKGREEGVRKGEDGERIEKMKK